MKAFDRIGVVVVVVWVAFVGAYIYHTRQSTQVGGGHLSAQFTMQPGESWLVLRRGEFDAGYVYQTRTWLEDGWLVEHQIYAALTQDASTEVIEAAVRARLDVNGHLQKFSAQLDVGEHQVRTEGSIQAGTLRATRTLDGTSSAYEVALDGPVGLSQTIFHALVAEPALQVDQTYDRHVFDPMTMQVSELRMRYMGLETLDLYEEKFAGHKFLQLTGQRPLVMYADPQGEVLIQALPAELISSRVSATLGRTRAASIERQVDERRKQSNAPTPPKPVDLDQAFAILAGHTQPEPSDTAADAPPLDPSLPE